MNGSMSDGESDILTAFVKQYYLGTPYLPKEILIQSEINDRELLLSLIHI